MRDFLKDQKSYELSLKRIHSLLEKKNALFLNRSCRQKHHRSVKVSTVPQYFNIFI